MPPVRRKRSTINLLVPFLIIALVFGALLWNKYRTTRLVNPKPAARLATGKRTAVLFFVAEGSRLAREAREMEPCNDEAACVKETLDELAYGPLGDLDDALPQGTLLNSVRFEGTAAVVDLNRAFVDAMPSGSSAEMMAVYSIVNTVCLNFPKTGGVRLTVDGAGGVLLRHLDLSAPLSPDYTLEAPPPADGVGAAQPPHSNTKGKP